MGNSPHRACCTALCCAVLGGLLPELASAPSLPPPPIKSGLFMESGSTPALRCLLPEPQHLVRYWLCLPQSV